MFPLQSLKEILNFFTGDPDRELTYRLFQANHTVVLATVLADVHGAGKESDFGGYAAKAAEVEAEAANAGTGEVKLVGAELTWTKTGAPETVQQVNGAYATWKDETGTVRLFSAWNLPAPVAISTAGNEVKVKVDWYAKTYNP